MTNEIVLPTDEAAGMSAYDGQVWKALNEHWMRRSNRRGLPNWASTGLDRAGEAAGNAAGRITHAVPEVVKEPLRHASEAAAHAALRPALGAATAMVDLVNDWALELNDPQSVEKLARKRGVELKTFTELRDQDLKFCDRLLTANTLKWRSAGALEGGAMGLLAMVPVAGIPLSISADLLVVQVLSTSIAARVAYSYGYDAKDPEEQAFIERLVRRSFMAQALKAKPLNDTAKAAFAAKNRVRWSAKLRADHPLLVALEKLMKQLPSAGGRVSVESVAKVVPLIGIVLGAGINSTVLGNMSADAKRYCQTRFLCEKYGLPLPAALYNDRYEEDGSDTA